MEEFNKLSEELHRHRELMFFTIGKTIQDATRLLDLNIFDSLKFTIKITEKFIDYNTEPENRKIFEGIDEETIFNTTLEQFLKNLNSEFSLSLLDHVEKIDDIRMLISPLSSINSYHSFIKFLYEADHREHYNIDICIFCLYGALRFYKELGTKPGGIVSVDDDVSLLLKIDREVGFIREEIAAALATNEYKTK